MYRPSIEPVQMFGMPLADFRRRVSAVVHFGVAFLMGFATGLVI